MATEHYVVKVFFNNDLLQNQFANYMKLDLQHLGYAISKACLFSYQWRVPETYNTGTFNEIGPVRWQI